MKIQATLELRLLLSGSRRDKLQIGLRENDRPHRQWRISCSMHQLQEAANFLKATD